ncbi:Alpha/Beta hydrolase protein [Chaetomium sp. MPI-SDFR-AT-0129]|nr:Alpha/Beta hydrolase protein [Chaetomium sp. MPI-SDFR-AT-0129]
MRPLYLLASLASLGTTTAQRPTVTLQDAVYIGTTTQVASGSATAVVDKFLGIPYAATPERFRAALPRPKGSATVNATEQPVACIQQSPSNPSTPESEDCLFLNVFAPHISPPNNTNTSCSNRKPKSKEEKQKKAVLLWFYGGALAFGSILPTSGTSLAANQDIILVACNYRLGVFGFPGSASLGLPSNELNPGFRDQKMALRWIRENIEQFGGDPGKVTIFGESAGGVSVDSQLLSYWQDDGEGGEGEGEETEKVPFRGAVLQSGGLHTFNRIALGVGVEVTGMGTGNREGEEPFVTLAKSLGCGEGDVVACVQGKEVEEVKNAVLDLNLLFAPVDDGGQTSVGDSDSARRAGRTVKVPVLIGSTFFEGGIFSDAALQATSLAEWADVIYPDNATAAKAVVEAYAVGSSWDVATEEEAVKLLHSDFQFACTTTYDADMIAGIDIPTWRYVFNASLPNGLASHGSEISFVFGDPQSTPGNEALSAKIQKAWADFAKDPSAGPGWEQYVTGTKSLADLGGEGDRKSITLVDPEAVDSRCSVFWQAYDPARFSQP